MLRVSFFILIISGSLLFSCFSSKNSDNNSDTNNVLVPKFTYKNSDNFSITFSNNRKCILKLTNVSIIDSLGFNKNNYEILLFSAIKETFNQFEKSLWILSTNDSNFDLTEIVYPGTIRDLTGEIILGEYKFFIGNIFNDSKKYFVLLEKELNENDKTINSKMYRFFNKNNNLEIVTEIKDNNLESLNLILNKIKLGLAQEIEGFERSYTEY
jgi:hypothetical protein